jgi:hypothetical protein
MKYRGHGFRRLNLLLLPVVAVLGRVEALDYARGITPMTSRSEDAARA